jgi:hypothetical protein
VVDSIKKPRSKYLLPKETYITGKYKHKLNVKGWKKIFQVNAIQKQAEVAKLIPDKADFKTKLIRVEKKVNLY